MRRRLDDLAARGVKRRSLRGAKGRSADEPRGRRPTPAPAARACSCCCRWASSRRWRSSSWRGWNRASTPAPCPRSLIGKPAPEFDAAAARRPRRAGPRPRRPRRPRDAGQRLRLVVRALPRGAPGADGARQGPAGPRRRHQLQGRPRQRAPLPRPSSATRTRRSASMRTAARRSTGASMACRRRSSSGPDGVIRDKIIGPVTAAAVTGVILPAVEKALAPRRPPR